MRGDLKPTDEQAEAVRLAMTGRHLAVEALAGTGKTTLMTMIAHAKPDQSAAYLAFNKKIAVEAEGKFPPNVRCSTIHSLAFRAVGKRYAHRLSGRRITSNEIAKRARIDPLTLETPFGQKRLAAGFLAGIVTKGVRRFCQTSDEVPSWRHIPTPDTMRDDPDMKQGWDQIRRDLEPALRKAWADICDVDGSMPFDHNCYLKLWTLGHPTIPADYVMIDELQDTNGCMLSLIADQRACSQVIGVGDARQSIMEWNGAVDAISRIDVDVRCVLSRSFRFGAEIAAVANDVLAMFGHEVRVVGCGGPGRVGRVEFPDVILSRTNAAAVRRALEEIDNGGKPHIVGGASDVVAFAKGALDLMEGRQSYHPELCCFDDWSDVRVYVADDELGGDLRLLVRLVEDFGAERIVSALGAMVSERGASLVLSTAHKLKGGEASAVRLASDFPDRDKSDGLPSGQEGNLLYVAVTRAKCELDVESVGLLRPKARAEPALGVSR